MADIESNIDQDLSPGASAPTGGIESSIDQDLSSNQSNAAPIEHQIDSDLNNDKYSTPGQQLGTVAEGVAQGVAGPLATAAELGLSKLGVPGLSAEDQAGRVQANPVEHGLAEATGLLGSAIAGVGEAGLIAKGLTKILPLAAESSAFAKIGSTVVKGMLEAGLVQGGDEMSNAMLGKADPTAPVAAALTHMGAAALLGGISSGVFSTIGQASTKGLQALEDAKMGTKAQQFLTGFGAASKGEDAIDSLMALHDSAGSKVPTALKMGMDAYTQGIASTVDKAVDLAVTATGVSTGGLTGFIAGRALAPMIEAIIDKPITRAAQKIVAPAVARVLSSGDTNGLWQVLDYATKVSKGVQQMTEATNSIFKYGSQQAANSYEVSERDKQQLKDFIEQGGVNKQLENSMTGQDQSTPQYAEGGHVDPIRPDPIAQHFPEQNVMLSTAKGRISNYLNSIRPLDPQGLAYDRPAKDHVKERAYDRALDIALKPLSITKHIKSGTLQAADLAHLQAMYPEIRQQLSSGIMKKITEGKLNEDKMPNYKTRLSLSLFMGAPLDSSMTPSSIMAAQQAIAPPPQAQQGQQQGKTKKGTTNLGKSNKSYQTPEQNAELDRSTRKE